MDDHPLTCTPETDLDEVRRIMLGRHARYMPVMSERTLMGVISFYDVARAVVDSQDFENRMLKAYIRDWPVESRDELPSSQKPNDLMSGSTLGTLFRVTNFGESHGPAIGCVVDGCPPGMALSEADIQPELDRRRPGTSPPRHPAPGGRQGRDPLRRVRGHDHRHADRPPDPQHRPAQQGLRATCSTPSARATPTTPTGTSTAFAIRAAAGGHRRGSPRRWSPRRRSPASG